ncbi:DUF5131 family protein [Planctomicrobium sp. SH661]|uniref:DUF5131 family protein n=1 Tax=Planctomicrobium sp. SH661 TaxID=3448124 RepID=UPI003F5B73CE
MAEHSKIEWTDATWNPWQGCTKVSPACQNCYMFRDMKRYGKDGSIVHRSSDQTFDLPLKMSREGGYKIPAGSKVFTCSWSDWFHEQSDAWRPEAWEIIRQRPDLTFQIVTKRTERIADCLPPGWGNGWPNVWLIATVENQLWAEIRIPQLIEIPASVRGLSIEPMLGSINLQPWLSKIHWVITGGETGPGSRPWHEDWRLQIHEQCQAAGVAYFHKQHGEWVPMNHYSPFVHGKNIDRFEHRFLYPNGSSDTKDRNNRLMLPTSCIRVGQKSGREIDGREWSDFPEVQPTSL